MENQRFFGFNNGKLLARLGQLEAALNCFDRTLELNETDYEAWSEKGCLLDKMGRWVEAEICFNHSLGVFAQEINLSRQEILSHQANEDNSLLRTTLTCHE